MFFITGDTHGNQYKWVEQIEPVLSPADIVLVCGDFGVGFWNGRYWSEETFYDFLSEQEYTVLFIDGNHENFDKLNSYPVENWCDGKVHKMLRLLCGFLDPTGGTVLLDGEDIRRYNRRDYYRLIAAVFQQSSVLAGTIAENVAQATDGIDAARVRRCLEQAGLSNKVRSLPGGEETLLNRNVYENAVELSGGEMQRLLLARALYKNAPILVLDEPTAALDAITESALYRQYNEMTRGCTAIYISHRLASTRFCDRIILVEGGKIAEEGTHEALMAQGGAYAALFAVQSKYYQEEARQNEAD